MQPRIDRSAAWAFALSLYKNPAIAKACLALQDEFNCNVNLILFSHYADSLGITLDSEHFLAIQQAIKTSEERLARHRSLRRIAKTESVHNYQALLKQELDFEHDQHGSIIECVNTLLDAPVNGDVDSELGSKASSLQQYLNWHELNSQQIKKYCDIIAT